MDMWGALTSHLGRVPHPTPVPPVEELRFCQELAPVSWPRLDKDIGGYPVH